MSQAYWAESLATELSQGDLLEGVWVGSQFHPRAGLQRGPTAKGGAVTWIELSEWKSGADGRGHFLARGRSTSALVLSQSCEIDKKGGSAPVLIAPVLDLGATVSAHADQENIRRGLRYAFFPLEGRADLLQESYVDFRAISYVPRAVLDASKRMASGSDAGLRRLEAHLVAFFTRIPMNQLKA